MNDYLLKFLDVMKSFKNKTENNYINYLESKKLAWIEKNKMY